MAKIFEFEGKKTHVRGRYRTKGRRLIYGDFKG